MLRMNYDLCTVGCSGCKNPDLCATESYHSARISTYALRFESNCKNSDLCTGESGREGKNLYLCTNGTQKSVLMHDRTLSQCKNLHLCTIPGVHLSSWKTSHRSDLRVWMRAALEEVRSSHISRYSCTPKPMSRT